MRAERNGQRDVVYQRTYLGATSVTALCQAVALFVARERLDPLSEKSP